MKVIIWGATGMVGQGVLRECLLADDVTTVIALGRSAPRVQHAKLQILIHTDLLRYDEITHRLGGVDAAFFCLGVSSVGMDEQRYTAITNDLTLAAAGALARISPASTFVYLSGAGADSAEKSRTMWERVRGGTENALQRLGLKAVYIIRPGIILPKHGARSKTALYRLLYLLLVPVATLLRPLYPRSILTTETIGRAMLNLARRGFPRPVLETGDIYDISRIPAATAET
ncbi:NAD(P)H-binding protein [Acerihabitans arboris]|uniref:NAD(P)H-binding protein n=1 Tax=Acerihabitans arboris TaxID=2691583 RepID=A0A845SJI2_9GAMM|nr:NAD(P)H-binding protein [Acerihabitans arboris]NDL64099.1 NAD(P)H-binding protein [Acerihabitans arboris]